MSFAEDLFSGQVIVITGGTSGIGAADGNGLREAGRQGLRDRPQCERAACAAP